MRRRDFIAGLACAAWPLAARAQLQKPVVGFLAAWPGSPQSWPPEIIAAFRKGLSETGYIEGRNVIFEYRSAQQYEQLPALAGQLVSERVAVIVTLATPLAAHAAKAATSTIPIVFSSGGDPIELGLVPSLNRPGGNMTGVSYFVRDLQPKRLELLHEMLPHAKTVGVLMNPAGAGVSVVDYMAPLETAAHRLGQEIMMQRAASSEEIDAAFAEYGRKHVEAVFVAGDAFFASRTVQLVTLAAQYKIPTSYFVRSFVDAGGLMSYGDDRSESHRQVGAYVGRILNGDKPGDLPVVQPTKYALVINKKTANALGLTIPVTLLVFADEIIE